MEFIVQRQNETMVTLSRRIGYRVIGVEENNEYSIIRELSRNRYPRFHIYAREIKKTGEFVFNLHLDQKMPSYNGSGAHAHSGEYEGDVIDKESQRIKNILKNS